MGKKTFFALSRWYEWTVVPKLKSAWTKATAGKNPDDTWPQLRGLEGTVNTQRITLQKFVNGEIAIKERGHGASAGGQDEVDVSDKARVQLLVEYLGIEIGDNDEVDEVDEV
jgi:hypothetical protein